MLRPARNLYEIGPFTVDPVSRVLLRYGEPVALNPKAFDILLVLIERSGEVLTKDELMSAVWPDAVVEENNLTRNVSSLRKALGENPSDHRYIVTLPGRGYSFVATVTEVQHLDSAGENRGRPRITALEEALPAQKVSRAVPFRLLPIVLTLSLAAAALGALVYWLVTHRRPNAPASLPSQLQISRLTVSGNVVTSAISPDGKYLAYATKLNERPSLWIKQVASSSPRQLLSEAEQDYYSVAFSPDGTHIYYIARLWNEANAALYRVAKLGGETPEQLLREADSFSVSPDGRRIAYVIDDSESRLIVASADGTGARQIATRKHPDFFTSDPPTSPAWSPDGKMIACAAGRSAAEGHYVSIVAVTADDGTERQLTSKRWFSTGHLVWLSDNSLLLSAADKMFSPRQVWHVSGSGKEIRQVTQDEHDYSSITVTADGSRVTALQTARTTSFWVGSGEDSATNRRIAAEVGYRNALEGFAWTPDGRLVFASKASGNPDIWMMQADGTEQTRLTSHEGVDFHPSVSSDGRYIVFSSDRAGVLNIWRMSLEGRDLVRLTYGFGELYPETSTDGKWVVYQQSNRIWKVPVEGGKAQLVVNRHSIRPTISPDNRRIAHFSMRDGKWGLEVSSITDGSLLERFVLPPSVNARVVRWTSDGQGLAYVAGTGGISNIWIRPLSRGEPRQVTEFTSERISYFAWSREGKLACSRGTETSDVIVLGGFTTP